MNKTETLEQLDPALEDPKQWAKKMLEKLEPKFGSGKHDLPDIAGYAMPTEQQMLDYLRGVALGRETVDPYIVRTWRYENIAS